MGRAFVIDAATIEIHGQRIRLHGVDVPENGQDCFVPDGPRGEIPIQVRVWRDTLRWLPAKTFRCC